MGQRLGALRFFYIKVLKRDWSVAETPYPRRVIRLPLVLSQEEVSQLIEAATVALPSHHADDPLCHRSTPRRGGSFEGQ